MCTTECFLASLDKQSFKHAIEKGMQRALADNIEFLKGIPFFQGWTKNTLTKFLLYSVEIQKTVRNQVICKEGEALNYVYFVKAGEFKVLQKSEHFREREGFVKNILVQAKAGVKEEGSRVGIVDPYKLANLASVNQLKKETRNISSTELCKYGAG